MVLRVHCCISIHTCNHGDTPPTVVSWPVPECAMSKSAEKWVNYYYLLLTQDWSLPSIMSIAVYYNQHLTAQGRSLHRHPSHAECNHRPEHKRPADSGSHSVYNSLIHNTSIIYGSLATATASASAAAAVQVQGRSP